MNTAVRTTTEEVLKVLLLIDWSWGIDAWKEIATKLDLKKLDEVPGRTTYSFLKNQELSAYFSAETLDYIEVPLSVFFNAEYLSSEQYEDKMTEFYEMYSEAIEAAIPFLGHPESEGDSDSLEFPEEFDALYMGLWSIKNARIFISLAHCDQELPIILSILVTPMSD